MTVNAVLNVLLNLFRRSPIRMGRVDNSRINRTRIRNAQFVSFMSEGRCLSGRDSDRYDARLRRQKLMRSLATLAAAAGLAWIVVESARAISMF
ncbi:MAG: hypothetical protein ABII82_06100 [Verrucomicrobiota bacterium]